MDSEVIILMSGMVAEIALILLLIKQRVFRTFPAFFVYLCWSLFSDTLFYYVRARYSQTIFFRISLIQLTVDSLMIFVLLVEVAWSVLRPIRSSLPKYSWIGIASLLALGCLILWPIAGLVAPDNLSPVGMTLFRLQQTPAILRAVFFLALAAFSQALSIGWRDRELQIASGLGFYSIASLAVTMVHIHQMSGTQQYHWLDVLAGISYLAALAYWVYCFARQPVERREFSPQMHSMLMAVAGVARSTRIALKDSASDKTGKHQH
ncbi:MAG: hypothetical protein P4L50_00830 [Anaerolineaceae bacterium]|nr:hypothetical protein [Anaerolineaceae bacterium]